MTVTRRFPGQPASITGARRFVTETLRDQPDDVVELAELMTSELATNAVQHAQSDFELTVEITATQLRVQVRDDGQGQPTLRSPAPRDYSGRGLRIVEAMSETWGITPSSEGKLVWFTLPVQHVEVDEAGRLASTREMSDEQAGRRSARVVGGRLPPPTSCSRPSPPERRACARARPPSAIRRHLPKEPTRRVTGAFGDISP